MFNSYRYRTRFPFIIGYRVTDIKTNSHTEQSFDSCNSTGLLDSW